MGQLWTDEMEEHWQAVFEEAANPTDFLIAHDINLHDRLRALFRYVVAAIRYRILGGWEPSSLQRQIESANIERQLGPERLAEAGAWLKEEPFDFSEHCDFLDS